MWAYVDRLIDKTQLNKVICVTNKRYDEVVWFYPVEGSDNERYVSYNVIDDSWSIGMLPRTCWLDSDSFDNPVAFDPENLKLAEHESGYRDDINDEPLNAYIESGPIELSVEGGFDKGDRMAFIRRILPDITFMGAEDVSPNPNVTMTLKMMDKPGGGIDTSGGGAVARSSSASATVEEFTEEVHVRLRGRSLTLRIESEADGTQWRMGVPRIDVRTDGQR